MDVIAPVWHDFNLLWPPNPRKSWKILRSWFAYLWNSLHHVIWCSPFASRSLGLRCQTLPPGYSVPSAFSCNNIKHIVAMHCMHCSHNIRDYTVYSTHLTYFWLVAILFRYSICTWTIFAPGASNLAFYSNKSWDWMLQERQTMDEFDTRSFFWKLGSPTVLLLIAHKTQQNVLLSQID